MLFDSSARYGGWIDRVKGIISAYELARLTGRQLRLYAGPPFPIAELLRPATFDWRIEPRELRWNPLNTSFHVSRDRISPAFLALREASHPNLFVDTNLDYLPRLHPERDPAQLRALWSERFHELFALEPALEAEVAAHAIPGATAIHARFTGLLGDFTDVVDNALAPAEREALLGQCIERVRARAVRGGPLLVFSDSPTFLSRAAELANVVVVPGTPAHIDRTSSPRETLRKTLLDFFVMTRCARIVLLRVGPMYPSAFSRYASYVNDAEWSEVT